MRGAFAPFVLVLTVVALAACDGAPEPSAASATPAAVADRPSGQDVVMPLDAPPQEESDPVIGPVGTTHCDADIGADAAARLVQRCIAVSPATHPPCHVSNPCPLIQNEIDRSCAMYGPGEDRPAECTAADVPAKMNEG